MCCWMGGEWIGSLPVFRVQHPDKGLGKWICAIREEPNWQDWWASSAHLNVNHSHFHYAQSSKLGLKLLFNIPDKVKTNGYLYIISIVPLSLRKVLPPQCQKWFYFENHVTNNEPASTENVFSLTHCAKADWFCSTSVVKHPKTKHSGVEDGKVSLQ